METVIITGASSGFGKAIALRFLQEGYNVIALARRSDKLQQLKDQFPGHVLPAIVDITDKKSVSEMLNSCAE
jgi:3-hydroxy acid dehydrogenase/malonic semialdehyde reductase